MENRAPLKKLTLSALSKIKAPAKNGLISKLYPTQPLKMNSIEHKEICIIVIHALIVSGQEALKH
jgi:hypothetical protein